MTVLNRLAGLFRRPKQSVSLKGQKVRRVSDERADIIARKLRKKTVNLDDVEAVLQDTGFLNKCNYPRGKRSATQRALNRLIERGQAKRLARNSYQIHG